MILEKHTLSDGRRVWIQRIKVPGVRKPFWTVVISPEWGEPEITDNLTKDSAYALLADILKADVCETAL